MRAKVRWFMRAFQRNGKKRKTCCNPKLTMTFVHFSKYTHAIGQNRSRWLVLLLSRHSTKQGLDLCTRGPADSWTRRLCFFNFTKMRKKHRKTRNELDFRIIFFVLCTMPHRRAFPPERNKGFIIYSVCSVLFIRRD